MYRGYKRSRRPQQLGFSAEFLRRKTATHVSKHVLETRNRVKTTIQRVRVLTCCFAKKMEHGLYFNLFLCVSFFNRKKLNELHVDGLLGQEGEVRVGGCEEEGERRRRSHKSKNAAWFEVSRSYLEPKFISPGWSDPSHRYTFTIYFPLLVSHLFFSSRNQCYFCGDACNEYSVGIFSLILLETQSQRQTLAGAFLTTMYLFLQPIDWVIIIKL